MAFDQGNTDVDRTVHLDDLSLSALISLINRLKETETTDHFLCRELELDQAYFYADYELKDAKSEEMPETRIAELSRIREHVIRAHDYVGESNIHAAIEELNVVVGLKIGL